MLNKVSKFDDDVYCVCGRTGLLLKLLNKVNKLTSIYGNIVKISKDRHDPTAYITIEVDDEQAKQISIGEACLQQGE